MYFMGADDILYSDDVLENIANSVENESVEAIYGNVLRSANNNVYDGEFTEISFLTKNISHQALFLKRGIFNKLGFFDLKYKILADWDLKFKMVFEPFYQKKIHRPYSCNL